MDRVGADRRATVVLGLLAGVLLLTSGCVGGAASGETPGLETYVIESPTATPTVTPLPSPVTVRVLDPESGDATMVSRPGGGTILIDTGGDANATAVRAALDANGVDRLDVLFTTGVSTGEVGGAATVVSRYRPRSIGQNGLVAPTDRYDAYLRAVVRAGRATRFYAVTNATGFEYGRGRVSALAPPNPPLNEGRPADNVVVVSYAVHDERVLVLGDASDREQRWLQRRNESLDATVLIVDEPDVPRSALLRAVSPEIIVVADGNASMAAELPDGNWTVYRTASAGPVGISIDPSGRTISVGDGVRGTGPTRGANGSKTPSPNRPQATA